MKLINKSNCMCVCLCVCVCTEIWNWSKYSLSQQSPYAQYHACRTNLPFIDFPTTKNVSMFLLYMVFYAWLVCSLWKFANATLANSPCSRLFHSNWGVRAAMFLFFFFFLEPTTQFAQQAYFAQLALPHEKCYLLFYTPSWSPDHIDDMAVAFIPLSLCWVLLSKGKWDLPISSPVLPTQSLSFFAALLESVSSGSADELSGPALKNWCIWVILRQSIMAVIFWRGRSMSQAGLWYGVMLYW